MKKSHTVPVAQFWQYRFYHPDLVALPAGLSLPGSRRCMCRMLSCKTLQSSPVLGAQRTN